HPPAADERNGRISRTLRNGRLRLLLDACACDQQAVARALPPSRFAGLTDLVDDRTAARKSLIRRATVELFEIMVGVALLLAGIFGFTRCSAGAAQPHAGRERLQRLTCC